MVSVARVLDREAEEPAAASTLHRDLENGVAEQSVKAGLQHREHHPICQRALGALHVRHGRHLRSASYPILPVSAGGLGTVLYGMQEEALLSCVEKHPQVPVEHRPVLAAAARSLIDASQDCGLVVLGSRGRSGVVGGLTGSVSGHVLRHAYCPVAVVRG